MRIGDKKEKKMEKNYQISIILEKDMNEANGNCYFPVFSLPPPQLGINNDNKLHDLEQEKGTWYLGTIFFEKYFVVFNNSPHLTNEDGYNDVGISHCTSHEDHVNLIDDITD